MKIRTRFAVPGAGETAAVRNHVTGLPTVCEEASCPNLAHCFGRGTATFLIMGNRCTRRCGFCDVATGRPAPLDPTEPARLARSVAQMGLRHAVITSVDRDDLADGGSGHFAACIGAIRATSPRTTIEVLIPDFRADPALLETVFEARPDVINHNLETVPSLFRSICPQSDYENSLTVLRLSAARGFPVKTGLILGLGEERAEVEQVILDAFQAGARLLTIGQYLQPSPEHAPLREYASPDTFAALRQMALDLGYVHVEAGPRVRSSFHAEEAAGAGGTADADGDPELAQAARVPESLVPVGKSADGEKKQQIRPEKMSIL